MPAPSKSNPDGVGVNGEYAGFVAPSRPDTKLADYYPADHEQSLQVDRARINPTRDTVTTNGSQVFPGGTSS